MAFKAFLKKSYYGLYSQETSSGSPKGSVRKQTVKSQVYWIFFSANIINNISNANLLTDFSENIFFFLSLHEKWSFPLRRSSVNMTKPAVNCGFGHIYWRNP